MHPEVERSEGRAAGSSPPHPALERRRGYWILLGASSLWLCLPFLAAWARADQLALAPLVYAFFDVVCHQRPERSVHLGGEQLAVCHRCLGLYSGFVLGLLALPYLQRLRQHLLDRPQLVLWCFAPMLIDVFLIPNTPWTRFGTGLAASFPVSLLAWLAMNQLLDSVALKVPLKLVGED